MKRLFSFCILFTSLCALPLISHAGVFSNPDTSLYVGIHGGGNIVDNIFIDPGYQIGATLGVRTASGFRFEGAYTYFENDTDIDLLPGLIPAIKGTIKLSTLMANGYYDFRNQKALRPYLGLGIGYLHGDSTIEGVAGSSSDNEFAYQGIVGLAYHFNQNVSLQGSYHYLDFTNSDSFYNVFNLGVSYYF